MSVRETGTVSWFDASKCYGFITRDQGGEASVYYYSFRDKDSCLLLKGSRVEFIVINTVQGSQVKDLIVID